MWDCWDSRAHVRFGGLSYESDNHGAERGLRLNSSDLGDGFELGSARK